MAYLDDRSRVNGRIVLMTIPAFAFFLLLLMQRTAAVDSTSVVVDVEEGLGYVSKLVWISPLFVLIQLGMIVRGLAASSVQNWLCVVVTAAAAFMIWRPSLGL
ncbi:MAG TPA: hypothetical protein VM096_15320 [Vicinamibacterales bacterium]|nr:hypothetical protein [Vicinamibacterales bacterium]